MKPKRRLWTSTQLWPLYAAFAWATRLGKRRFYALRTCASWFVEPKKTVAWHQRNSCVADVVGQPNRNNGGARPGRTGPGIVRTLEGESGRAGPGEFDQVGGRQISNRHERDGQRGEVVRGSKVAMGRFHRNWTRAGPGGHDR